MPGETLSLNFAGDGLYYSLNLLLSVWSQDLLAAEGKTFDLELMFFSSRVILFTSW